MIELKKKESFIRLLTCIKWDMWVKYILLGGFNGSF